MEYDSLQVCNATLQTALPVLPQIEFSILQAGLYNTFTTDANAARFVRQIGNCDEAWNQFSFPVAPLHRKTLLLILQNRLHNCLRQLQETFVKAPYDDLRPLSAGKDLFHSLLPQRNSNVRSTFLM